MVRVIQVSYSYTPGKRLGFPDISVATGEHCLILGESGSGKSTLLHLMGGLLRPHNGTILVDDIDITALAASALDAFRGRNIGFIFQKSHLITALTVRENLMLTWFLAGFKQDRQKVNALLGSLGLTEQADAKIHQLSQGQLQRAAIARAVLIEPRLILADEPTSALDDRNCERVITLLKTVAARSNASLVIATHDRRLKSEFANRVDLTEGLHV